MNESDMFTIRVPGSTANLGPGFDSIGMAMNLYLTVELVKNDRWEVHYETKELQNLPSDETNFICRKALETAEMYGCAMPPLKLSVRSDIPLARGLGSSAAAIVAAIEMADAVCQLNLDKHEKLKIAARMEKHPDNVGASLFGGLVVGSQIDEEVNLTSFHHLSFEAVAVVPSHELLTEASRKVLPESLSFEKAVQASAVSNQFLASLLSGNFAQAGKMMGMDLFHQPYRRKLVPHLGTVEKLAMEGGAFGTALSGAGPTVICLVESGKGRSLSDYLKDCLLEMEVFLLAIDQAGSHVTHHQTHSNRI